MKAVRGLVLLVAIAVLAGCETLQVRSDYVGDVDFSAYKTFAQIPAPEKPGGDLQGYSPITAERIQKAIAEVLQAKGYTRAPAGEADFLVGFSVDGQHRMDVFSFDTGWGWYGGSRVYTTHYVQGTLLIDVADRASKRVVWHGWGTDRVATDRQPEEAKIRATVEQILASYPPGKS